MADDSDKTASFRRDQLPLPSLEKGNACVVIVEGLRIGTQINLEKTETIIGRTEEADVSVDDRLVSREHAKIVLEEEGGQPSIFPR